MMNSFPAAAIMARISAILPRARLTIRLFLRAKNLPEALL
jgi:hypothetical protein